MSLLGFFDQFSTHTSHVDIIRNAGGTIPSEWDAIADRYAAMQSEETTFQSRLVKAIAAPAKTESLDVETLKALAFAQSSVGNNALADVMNEVRKEVGPALVLAYRPASQKNYELLASAFDDLAAEFDTLARIVDPEIPAEQIVGATDDRREAWARAQLVAQELDTALPALQSAAALHGLNVHTTDDLLPLVADLSSATRRKAWAAWDTDGRTGRWGALVRARITLRAADPDSFKRYRRPADLEERHISVGRGASRAVMVDPEEDIAPQIAEHKRLLGIG